MTTWHNHNALPDRETTHPDGTEFARPANRTQCWKVITSRSGRALPRPTQCRSRARTGKRCCFKHAGFEVDAQAFERLEE